MTNEETLNLLKPIMLDGTEKVGDKVFTIHGGELTISGISPAKTFKIQVSDGTTYTNKGQYTESARYPSLFKVNPFEWLAAQNNNQERVIEVTFDGEEWEPRVLIEQIEEYAICWNNAETFEEAKNETGKIVWAPGTWREVNTEKVITKEEALRRCDEIGIDVKDMLLNALSESGVDTTNLIIE